MASWTLLEIANTLYSWSAPVLALITLVFGILILTGKNKNLRLFGLGFVFGMGITLTSIIYRYLPKLYEEGVLDENFYRSGNASTVSMIIGLTSFAFTIVVMVLRWLYTRRAYGTGIGVLIAIMVLTVLRPVAQALTNKLVAGIYGASEFSRLSVYAGTLSLALSLAVTAVFLYVFYKNRTAEKSIPSYWVFLLLFIIADIIIHLISIGAVNNPNNDNYSLFGVTVSILALLVNPISSIYLFMGSRKPVGEES